MTISTPSPRPPPLPAARRLMPVVGLAIAVLGGVLGEWARHDLIEPVARTAACADSSAPWWCLARDTLRIAAQNFVLAGLALIAALAALLYRRKQAAAAIGVAMFLGGACMYLYSTTLAAIAVTVALLRAASLDRS